MGYKTKRILIRPNGEEKQIYPATITETYTGVAGSNVSLSKSGYKVIKVVFEVATTSTSSGNDGWENHTLRIGTDGSNTFNCQARGGYYWGVATPQIYGGFRSYISGTEADIYSFTSSNTSRTATAYSVELTEQRWRVKVGTTYGTWITETSGTYTSGQAALISTLFSSQNLNYWHNVGNTITVGTKRAVVTYQKA